MNFAGKLNARRGPNPMSPLQSDLTQSSGWTYEASLIPANCSWRIGVRLFLGMLFCGQTVC